MKDLVEIVSNYKDNIIAIAKIVGEAKHKKSKKEYKALIDEADLSKDQVSLSLKRFELLSDGMPEELLIDYSDRMIKKVTHKNVKNNPELLRQRRKLATGELSYDEFVKIIDSMKVEKTVDEKAVTKAEGLVKFCDKNNVGAETMMEIANILDDIWQYKNTEESEE